MATAPDPSPVKQMETLLECSICNETLTQPRTLSCFHSYCKHCLENFVATHRKKAVKAKAKVPEVFECPLCRTEFHIKEGEGVEKIPPNHFINNMLELLTLQQQVQRIKCQSCKVQDPAASRCISCERYLCGKCLEVHKNWIAFEDHVVLTLVELAKPENRAKARGKPRCEKHNKVLKFYCETCNVLVCRYCVDVNHARLEHLWFPLADVVVKHKEVLKKSSAIFEQQMNKAIQSNLKIEHAMETLNNNTTKAKDAIIQQQQEILNALIKKLEERTAVLLDQVDMKYNEASKPLMKQQADVKACFQKAKSSLDFAKNIISNGNDEEILLLKNEVEEKARNIEKESPELMEPVHNGSIRYQAKPSKGVLEHVTLNDLGSIVSPAVKQPRKEQDKLTRLLREKNLTKEKRLKSQKKREKLEDDNIGKLSKQQIIEIEHLCEMNDIQVAFEKELNRIVVVGHSEDISKTFAVIFQILKRIGEAEKEKEKAALHADLAEMVCKRVQWFYIDPKSGDYEEYDKQINIIVEKAYSKKEKSVIFLLDDEKCEIIFDRMEETNLDTNETLKVIRKDLKADVSVPEYWEPQPRDARGKELTVHLVTLNPNNPNHKDEYKNISDHFQQTARQRILQIQRIQNPSLFKQYLVRKQSLDEKNGSNEKFLFHGTRGDKINEINENGLNRSYAGNTHGGPYGKGVYFARDASMSVGYTPVNFSTGKRYMYYTRVAVGQYAVGNQSMLVPPQKGGYSNDSYDSTVNDTRNPTIFVLYYDNQYYPEYLITFV